MQNKDKKERKDGLKDGTIEVKYDEFSHKTIKLYFDSVYRLPLADISLMDLLDLIRFIHYEGKSSM